MLRRFIHTRKLKQEFSPPLPPKIEDIRFSIPTFYRGSYSTTPNKELYEVRPLTEQRFGKYGFLITLDRDFGIRSLKYTLSTEEFHELLNSAEGILCSQDPEGHSHYRFVKFIGELPIQKRPHTSHFTGLLSGLNLGSERSRGNDLVMNPTDFNALYRDIRSRIRYSTINIDSEENSVSLIDLWKNWIEFMKPRI